jgi:hypothetical protein
MVLTIVGCTIAIVASVLWVGLQVGKNGRSASQWFERIDGILAAIEAHTAFLEKE